MIFLWLLAAACGGGTAPQPGSPPATAPASPHPAVILPDHTTVAVEVAAEDETRAQGLMYRESVPEGKGMLFLFRESGMYPFWMKNTIVPLDIIWIDDAGRVVHISRDTPPCPGDPCPNFSPEAMARYVLELRGGSAAAHRLKVGDRIEMRNLEGIRVQ